MRYHHRATVQRTGTTSCLKFEFDIPVGMLLFSM